MRNMILLWTCVSAMPLVALADVTKEDVKKLASAGLSEEIILSYIRANGPVTKLSADDLVELKGAGASDRVLGAMVGKAQTSALAGKANGKYVCSMDGGERTTPGPCPKCGMKLGEGAWVSGSSSAAPPVAEYANRTVATPQTTYIYESQPYYSGAAYDPGCASSYGYSYPSFGYSYSYGRPYRGYSFSYGGRGGRCGW